MHDLLRDMGREIVRDKSPKELEKRSRLWFHEDVLDVLSDQTGTKAVEGLTLKLPGLSAQRFSTKAFKKMKKLRLLQLSGVKLDGDFKYLSRNLSWLCWNGFPLTCIPSNFYQRNLVSIELENSNIKLVWKEMQRMENLKILNLSHSHHLTQTPDFSKMPNLEKLILKDCPRLSEVSHTIGHLHKVLLINLKDCISLSNLPRTIYSLKSLKNLILSGCLRIDKLEEDIEQMESLTTLIADNTAITEVPFSLARSKNIGYISLCGYKGSAREVFPSIIQSWMSPTNKLSSLVQTPAGMSSLVSLDASKSSSHSLSSISEVLRKVLSLFVECGSELQLSRDAILDALSSANSQKLESTATTSLVSIVTTTTLIECCGQVHISATKKSLKSLLFRMGMNCQAADVLKERILQEILERSFSRYEASSAEQKLDPEILEKSFNQYAGSSGKQKLHSSRITSSDELDPEMDMCPFPSDEQLDTPGSRRKTIGQVVLPVFYDVDPSEVRRQTGEFGKAFQNALNKLYKVDEFMVPKWRDSLRDAAGLAGFVVLNSRNESEVIKDIVKNVTRFLDKTDLFIADNPVGLESRVQDIIQLLDTQQSNDGTKAVEGLTLKLPGLSAQCFSTKAFENMKKLRLLQLSGAQLDGDFKYLSRNLRWLCWNGFPLECIPANFFQRHLVSIELENSNVKLVWNEMQRMEQLKILNLSHSHYLTQTPDFSYMPNLEKLILKDCPRLSEVSHTIGHLRKVLLINLKDCISLSNLPRTIYTLKSLKNLILSGCLMIDKLEEDIEQMESLTTLIADNTAITEVPFSLVRSKSIGYISLCGYEGFSHDVFPSIIWSWMSPTNNLPSTMSSLVSLNASNSISHDLSSISNLLPKLQSLRLECGSKLQLTRVLKAINSTSSKEVESTATTSQVLDVKISSLIECDGQVNVSTTKNSLKSLLIQIGMNWPITNILKKSILQNLTIDGCGFLLPGDNYPDWLTFDSEGSSVIFEVPRVEERNLKTMICVVYSSSPNDVTSDDLKNVLVINHTKTTIQLYKREALSSFENEEWQSVVSNMEPGDKVEIVLVFENSFIVMKTTIYLVYDELIGENIVSSCNSVCREITQVSYNCHLVELVLLLVKACCNRCGMQ
ncbi:disease resistance protein RPV1 [Trifolium repens]|nr:disease resistance protein RPV1 [Trifolium repens]